MYSDTLREFVGTAKKTGFLPPTVTTQYQKLLFGL
jgi:hypothetical protein